MDYNTENVIIEFVRQPRLRGRPKRETPLTDDEKKQRARDIAKRHYEQNYEYRRLQKACYYERTKHLQNIEN